MNVGTHVVLKLMEPYHNNGHNVTMDNFFTCTELARKLKDKGSSIVGTVRSNRREMPPLTSYPNQHLYDLIILQDPESRASVTIYKAKRQKTVLVLSFIIRLNAVHKF